MSFLSRPFFLVPLVYVLCTFGVLFFIIDLHVCIFTYQKQKERVRTIIAKTLDNEELQSIH